MFSAQKLKENNNFASFFAVGAGLNIHSVSRLKNLWEELPQKYQQAFDEMMVHLTILHHHVSNIYIGLFWTEFAGQYKKLSKLQITLFFHNEVCDGKKGRRIGCAFIARARVFTGTYPIMIDLPNDERPLTCLLTPPLGFISSTSLHWCVHS